MVVGREMLGLHAVHRMGFQPELHRGRVGRVGHVGEDRLRDVGQDQALQGQAVGLVMLPGGVILDELVEMRAFLLVGDKIGHGGEDGGAEQARRQIVLHQGDEGIGDVGVADDQRLFEAEIVVALDHGRRTAARIVRVDDLLAAGHLAQLDRGIVGAQIDAGQVILDAVLRKHRGGRCDADLARGIGGGNHADLVELVRLHVVGDRLRQVTIRRAGLEHVGAGIGQHVGRCGQHHRPIGDQWHGGLDRAGDRGVEQQDAALAEQVARAIHRLFRAALVIAGQHLHLAALDAAMRVHVLLPPLYGGKLARADGGDRAGGRRDHADNQRVGGLRGQCGEGHKRGGGKK